MNTSYKPEGYSSVSPYLIVDNARGTIDFLVRVLRGTELRVMPDEATGRLIHAEVRVGDSVIMLADKNADWPPVPAHVYVYVPDVDAAYQRALAAGAEAVQAPVKKDDADKRGGVKDAGGTTWWIATQVE